MARYIDADALMTQMRRQFMFEKTDFDKRMLYVEKSVIENAPTADVVEVVRCKDCKSQMNCVMEDNFRFLGIENPFCCKGKKVE